MVNISLSACEGLIDMYVNNYGGQATTIEEGVLGLGKVVLHNAEGKKAVVITEKYLNANASYHTIRKYNKLPKKYKELIERV